MIDLSELKLDFLLRGSKFSIKQNGSANVC